VEWSLVRLCASEQATVINNTRRHIQLHHTLLLSLLTVTAHRVIRTSHEETQVTDSTEWGWSSTSNKQTRVTCSFNDSFWHWDSTCFSSSTFLFSSSTSC